MGGGTVMFVPGQPHAQRREREGQLVTIWLLGFISGVFSFTFININKEKKERISFCIKT